MVKILICDDSPAFSLQLSQKVARLAHGFGQPVEIKTCTQPEQITPESFGCPDIAFLDIDMGNINGIDLARKIRRAGLDTLLIFVTNYPEYAPEGYEVSAFRFLDKERLDQKLPYYFSQALHALESKGDQIQLSDEVFPSRCLVYGETHSRGLLLHMTGYHTPLLTCSKTMGELEKLLLPHGFLRVHQSFLVNMKYIRKMQSTGVWLTQGEELPISARNYKQLKETFLTWRAKNPWSTF